MVLQCFSTTTQVKAGSHLPEEVVPLHEDVDSMTEGGTVQVICMPQRGFLQQTAPLSVLAHTLVFQPVTDSGQTVGECTGMQCPLGD